MKVFLIAGEASGDALGAKLMHSLEKVYSEKIEFYGVGGERMERLGLKSLFPMSELSLLGFMEILPHIPKLLNRIKQTAEEIIRLSPDVVVTIDAPAFNNRVGRKLNELGARKKGIKLVHYVAPTVWAYKPERAEKIAKIYDHLMVLLPFEPPYFEKVGLKCSFVGHPVTEEDILDGDGTAFRKHNNIAENDKLLCVMPGSRNSEIKRLMPVFESTIKILQEKYNNLKTVFIAAPRMKERLHQITGNWSIKPVIIDEKSEKKNIYDASDFALVKSGTGTLELAMAGVPMVVAYKVNPLSAWMLRRMLKVKYVNLVNVILDKEVIPEILQENCVPENIAANLVRLIENENLRMEQVKNARLAMAKLKVDGLTPSDKAAEVIISVMKG